MLQQRLRACGVTTLEQSADRYGLGLTIGNAETRLIELVNAYACLARLGEWRPYRLLLDEPIIDAARVCDADAAYLVADILSDNHARSLAFGAHSAMRFDFPVACKTGTSSDFRDNWALGFTPEFTVGVWVGNFDGSPMENVSGVTGAAPVLHDVFAFLHQRHGTSWYEQPAETVQRNVHPITGKLLVQAQTGQDAVREKFMRHVLPREETADDYDSAGRVRLDSEYAGWLARGENWLVGRAVAEHRENNSQGVRIASPSPGATYILDPDLPERSQWLPLMAQGRGNLRWESESLRLVQRGDRSYAVLAVGKHRISAIDPALGKRFDAWIVVKSL